MLNKVLVTSSSRKDVSYLPEQLFSKSYSPEITQRVFLLKFSKLSDLNSLKELYSNVKIKFNREPKTTFKDLVQKLLILN